MSKPKKIIVFGGAAVEVDRSTGDAYIKEPFYHYLSDLASYGVPVVFFAMARWLDSADVRFTCSLRQAGVEVVPLKRGIKNWPLYWPKLLAYTKGAAFISFLPNALGLLPIVSILKRHLKVWAVYVGNDWIAHAAESNFRGIPLGRYFYLAAYEKMLKAASLGIARGKQAQIRMQTYCREVELTLPLGHIDLSQDLEAHRPVFQDSKRFLYVGKLEWRKGLGELLKAFKQYDERVEDCAELSIIGTGPDVDKIKELASDLGLTQKVDFAGWVDSGEVLSRHWGRSDALVMPSSIHKEGVPRVIDEALARGLPVCATAIGGVPDEFTNGEVHLVEPASVSALRDGMLEITNNESLRAGLITAGSRRIDLWRQFVSAGHQHYKMIEAVCARETRLEG
jgi:glycosyltransferase involved in cell wall biosynthesis|tara:strand:+ start:1507 stop:2691 length:1185 start_codon:yes stop_codon:yes gene_type:complete